MQTANLPEDILVIHYAALAPGSPPLVRLQVLAAIGHLLAGQDRSHAVDELLMDAQARLALRSWLTSEEAANFWTFEDGQAVSRSACEKHVLVGTRHLMDDLAALTVQPSQRRLVDPDTLWRAASVFADQHLGQESNSRGVENGR
jgi:hypothetical protein